MKRYVVLAGLAATLGLSSILAQSPAFADPTNGAYVSDAKVSQSNQPSATSQNDRGQATYQAADNAASISLANNQPASSGGGVGATSQGLTGGSGVLSANQPDHPRHPHDYMTPGEPGSMECGNC